MRAEATRAMGQKEKLICACICPSSNPTFHYNTIVCNHHVTSTQHRKHARKWVDNDMATTNTGALRSVKDDQETIESRWAEQQECRYGSSSCGDQVACLSDTSPTNGEKHRLNPTCIVITHSPCVSSLPVCRETSMIYAQGRSATGR